MSNKYQCAVSRRFLTLWVGVAAARHEPYRGAQQSKAGSSIAGHVRLRPAGSGEIFYLGRR